MSNTFNERKATIATVG